MDHKIVNFVILIVDMIDYELFILKYLKIFRKPFSNYFPIEIFYIGK